MSEELWYKKVTFTLTNVKRETGCVCLCICDGRPYSLCLCDSVHMCTHMHAYAHAINKPPSVPPTQLDSDGMSQYNPHSLERSLSFTHTQSYT